MTWAQVLDEGRLPKHPYAHKKYEQTGFATPSGKVELFSSVLADLGFDPLPYYREAAQPDGEYPLLMFVGLPDDEYYRTGHRFIPELRRRAQDPTLFLNVADAEALGLDEGSWAQVQTRTGAMKARVFVRSSMPSGLVRVPHGWWKPESESGLAVMSGMWDFADAQLTADDDPELIDREQGIPHLKGTPCRVSALEAEAVQALEARFGASARLPKGPEGKVLRSDAHASASARAGADFMHDEEFGDGVEFEAIELSLYGRSSL
jgi:anaerobic selenocysteine-containing dehydrogenase